MNEKSKIIKGGFWTGMSSAVTMLSQFARIMILTRFIDRSDFGVVAIINMIIGLCLAFGDLGFSSVIMYKQNISEKEFSSLYWLQLILYSIIYSVLCILSPIFSSFYGNEFLVVLIPLAAFSLLSLAIGKLYESVLQKKYEFRILSIRNIVSNVLSLFLAWWMAWEGYGIYSLIISTLFQNLFYNIWSLLAGLKYQKIIFYFNYRETKPLLKIGIYQTYTRIADYFSTQLDVLIIGKLLGTDVLGGYDLAKQLVSRFVTFFKQTVAQVALPVLANSNSDDASVKNKFFSVTKIVALICIPICFTIAVFSREILTIVYGSKYADMAIVASIFSLMTMITSITCFIDMLGIAKGRTDLNFKNTIYRIIFTTPMVVVTSLYSINLVAFGQLLASIVLSYVFWRVVAMKTYPMRLKEYLKLFANYFIVWFIMSASLYVVKDVLCVFSFVDNSLIQLLLYGLLGFSMVLISYFTILKQEIVFLLSLIKK